MAMKFDLYQTLEDRDNVDEVEENGPCYCDQSGAWLGEGYYFWEGHIESAHWWGNLNYGGSYIICHAKCDRNNKIWDLHDNAFHRNDFKEILNELKKVMSSNQRTPKFQK